MMFQNHVTKVAIVVSLSLGSCVLPNEFSAVGAARGGTTSNTESKGGDAGQGGSSVLGGTGGTNSTEGAVGGTSSHSTSALGGATTSTTVAHGGTTVLSSSYGGTGPLGTTSAAGGSGFGGATTTVLGGTGGTSVVSTAGTSSVGGGTQTTIAQGCVLLLHMDEPSWSAGANAVTDSSGVGNHGTAVAGAAAGRSGKFALGGWFDGTGYIDLGDNASLRPSTAFTLVAWIYPTMLNGTDAPGIAAKRQAYLDSTAFAVFVWTDNRLYVDVEGENDRFSSTATIPTNAWTHIAVVFDGGLAQASRTAVYFNGNLDSTHMETSASITASSAPFEVGRLRNGGQGFVGGLDDVAFFRRALSAEEIRALVLSGTPL